MPNWWDGRGAGAGAAARRAGLAYLAFIDLVTGLWAVVAPANWYRSFPGFGRHWAVVNPPYNHHLVVDAGAGFLAVGVLLAIAAWRPERILAIAALVTSLVHDVPHLLFHLQHPAAALSGFDTAMSSGGLAFDCVLAAVLLWWVIAWSHERTHANG